MATSLGNIEVYLDPGGDFVLDASGDLLLAIDASQEGLATQQRIQRVLLSRPVLRDANQAVICRPDDLFNPLFGAALQRQVGQMNLNGATEEARIRAALLAPPSNIASINTLTVTPLQSNNAFEITNLNVTTTAGQVVTIPSQIIQVLGG